MERGEVCQLSFQFGAPCGNARSQGGNEFGRLRRDWPKLPGAALHVSLGGDVLADHFWGEDAAQVGILIAAEDAGGGLYGVAPDLVNHRPGTGRVDDVTGFGEA